MMTLFKIYDFAQVKRRKALSEQLFFVFQPWRRLDPDPDLCKCIFYRSHFKSVTFTIIGLWWSRMAIILNDIISNIKELKNIDFYKKPRSWKSSQSEGNYFPRHFTLPGGFSQAKVYKRCLPHCKGITRLLYSITRTKSFKINSKSSNNWQNGWQLRVQI